MRKGIVTDLPRTPMDGYSHINMLVARFRERHEAGMSTDDGFDRLVSLFGPLIYKQANRLSNIAGRSDTYENARDDVISKFFELVVNYDLGPVYFGHYVQRKLSSWVTWECLKLRERDKEKTRYMDSSKLTQLQDSTAWEDDGFKVEVHETRSSLVNYKEATADMLFMRHVLKLTQAEIGEIYGVHQYTISLHLRNAHDHMQDSMVG